MYEIIRVGKQGLDGFIVQLGSMVAESIWVRMTLVDTKVKVQF